MIKQLKNKVQNTLKEESAFTLIEMTLVLFIISVLLLLIIPNIGSYQGTAQDTGNSALETVVQTQMDLYEMEKHAAPNTLEDLHGDGFLSESQYSEVKKLFTIDSNGNLVKLNGE
ncbi:competence protein ComGC [Marinilactibacillus piezotolerans]|uniref:Competence protein ComGC n=1 Tax=Marinilactibacillus piezotolerans TaxID=258723 RepID=A0A1I3WNG0_9LACT|nr:competence type IV pilus major pilin ComGC [Marinilactibacillus piezotolerans]SFK08683.1 competence protein ComGC [Marinilactibacillus piezotolerans]